MVRACGFRDESCPIWWWITMKACLGIRSAWRPCYNETCVLKPVAAMKLFLLALILILAISAAGLLAWRQIDHRADRAEMDRLLALQPTNPARFSNEMVAGLPEPARRYFTFAIAEGTPLHTVARIEMQGQFSLGTKEAPRYLDMQAIQVLAAPDGFLWKMFAGSGLMRMSGSDSGRWTRFWLAGLAPVARFGGDPDHTRSAFGRYAAEAAFWTPAAILPGPHISWENIGQDTVRYTMTHAGMAQPVDLTVDEAGRPIHIEFPRWSNANPEGIHRLQPFGAFLSDFREVQGFRVPFHVEAGNWFGTHNYYPFFIANVTEVRFPSPDPGR